MKKIYAWGVKTFLVVIITGILFVGSQTFAKTTIFEPTFTNNSISILVNNKLELEILKLVNAERRKKNLGSLAVDSRLSSLARSYSRKMAREKFFSHYDEDGSTVVDRAKDFNIKKWRKIGENLFTCVGYDNPARVAVRGWTKSSSHRKNMLGRSWTQTGIGVARSKDGEIYITQVFLAK